MPIRVRTPGRRGARRAANLRAARQSRISAAAIALAMVLAIVLEIVLALGLGTGPATAQAQSAPPGAVACLWRELPTVAKARVELAARLGRRVPVTLLNRFAGGELSALFERCGFADSVQTLTLTGQYWLAAAYEAIQGERLRVFALDRRMIEAELDRRAPAASRVALGAELAARAPGQARPLLVDILETLDRNRLAETGLPYSDQEKRLVIEFAATWLIREGLEAGAEPFAGPPPGVVFDPPKDGEPGAGRPIEPGADAPGNAQ